MDYDVIVIGGGLSGLTAAGLLAKRGLKTAVIDRNYNPGGSCGVFKRGDVIFDTGAAMLYGFGEQGFNAHRFIFNVLEEPIDIIRHDMLYRVNFGDKRIPFWLDVPRFADELAGCFPDEADSIHRFYRDMCRMYRHVMVESPNYTTPDEADPRTAAGNFLRHPISYIRFLSYLNMSAERLLRRYFKNPEIFNFFDKLTSTYCYATVAEAPAILAAVMFIDNHVGGSFYPAGSTLFLPGKLEKAIEEHGGDMILGREVTAILFEGGKPSGVRLDDGGTLRADNLVYSGTVWNLYGKLIDPSFSHKDRRKWAFRQVPTYPSVVLYSVVDREVIPEGTQPIEMLIGNPEALDESEVTAYILSIDDRTLCAADEHTVTAIGPTFRQWPARNSDEYPKMKAQEEERLISVLEKRFPGFLKGLRFHELATPRTIERYTLKNGGAVAGPKQMLGQHMFRRLHTRTEWDNFFCCGESTVMGTGTPTVSTEGLSAANALLKKMGKKTYVYRPGMKNWVRLVEKPYTRDQLYDTFSKAQQAVMRQALRCRLCEKPACARTDEMDVRGIMRRVAVGNFTGALKRWKEMPFADLARLEAFESACVLGRAGKPAAIREVIRFLEGMGA